MAGRGGIVKRGENSWRLTVYGGYDSGGKHQIRKCKTVHAPNKPAAETLLAEFVTEVEKGMYIDPTKLTFKEFAERWLRDYGEK